MQACNDGCTPAARAPGAVIDIDPYDERPSNSFPGFVERLVGWLPTSHKHECSVGRPGGFIERLRCGTYLGHIVEHVTLELQMWMGFDVAYHRGHCPGGAGTQDPGAAHYRQGQPGAARLRRPSERRPGQGGILIRVVANEAVKLTLQQQDLAMESVPEPGKIVRLRRNSNLSTGGTATDVMDDVPPSNARLAELAVQILALDVAGIDAVCRDISRPLTEQNGGIVEVNAAPGLRMHLHPSAGQPRDVGKPIVDMLYPPGSAARIPVIAITGTNGKTMVTRLVGQAAEDTHCHGPIATDTAPEIPRESEGAYFAVGATPAKARDNRG